MGYLCLPKAYSALEMKHKCHDLHTTFPNLCPSLNVTFISTELPPVFFLCSVILSGFGLPLFPLLDYKLPEGSSLSKALYIMGD